jgi:two-component system sensor histidine kinase/response regulator
MQLIRIIDWTPGRFHHRLDTMGDREAAKIDVSLLHRISRIANSDFKLDEILGQMVGLAAGILRCDACLIYLHETDTEDLVLRASQLPRSYGVATLRMKFGEGVTGWVAEHQTIVALGQNAAQDPRFKTFDTLVEDTYEALLSVPLINRSKTIGVINIHHRDPHPHSEDEINAIAFIGQQLSSAIAKTLLEDENARLADRYSREEQRRADLEEQVAQRTAQLKASNDELVMAKDKAEEMARLKSEFLANISHELRTPMNGIMGMTELVLDTELQAEQREFLQIVKSSAVSLLSIINNILDFSKLEARKVTLDDVEFELETTIGETIRSLAIPAQEKGLELTYAVESDVAPWVKGDVQCLRQVLVNLIGNAIKFTDQGEVVLRVSQDSNGDEDGGTVLHFAVSDTGMGIPADKQAGIFEAFVQADGSNTRAHGGTGLGLAISSNLAELMGGTIWVESESGRGSTFHFTARFGWVAGSHPQAARSGMEDLTGLPILVVDDNATNRKILTETLKRWGTRPVEAGSGFQALEILRAASRDGRPFGLILADVQMPGIDGLELARRLMDQPIPSRVPIVMLSSVGRHLSPAMCQELGISLYLTKPVTASSLFDAINKVVHVAVEELPAAAATPAQPGPVAMPRILVADDDSNNRMLVTNILRRNGYPVLIARDGLEAVDLFSKGAADLILMDLQMPLLGGLEATAAIRKREAASNNRPIPIIALTAHAMAGDRERCLAAGMDDHFSKPIRAHDLLEKIARFTAPPDGV